MATDIAKGNLTAWWRFGESSWDGTPAQVLDLSGYGKHGTAVGSLTTINSGKVASYSADFTDATTKYVDNLAVHLDTLSSWTVHASGLFELGRAFLGTPVNDLNGQIDEFRVQKGIAVWTSNFAPPIGEYHIPDVYGESVYGWL
jgi:hypothetical protein